MEEKNINTKTEVNKPNYITVFLFLMSVVLLLFGWGYQNAILGYVGIMCFVLVALKYIKDKRNK